MIIHTNVNYLTGAVYQKLLSFLSENKLPFVGSLIDQPKTNIRLQHMWFPYRKEYELQF